MARHAYLRLGLSLCVGAGACLLLLEGLLRILPVHDGLVSAEPRKDWPVHTLAPNASFTHSMEWNFTNVRHGHVNNLGYIAPFDYAPGSGGIAVLGNSFVAATMDSYADTLQGALDNYLTTPRQVLGFGTAGANLPDYLATARLVGERFAPDWGVLVVTDRDFSAGFRANAGYCRWARAAGSIIECKPEISRSWLDKCLRSLAIVRYVRTNLQFTLSNLINLRRAPPVKSARPECTKHELDEADRARVSGLLDALAPALGVSADHVIFVLDSDRSAMYAPPGAQAAPECPDRDELAIRYLQVEAQRRGMRVIDSEPIFARFVAAEHRRLDYSPNDNHWNGAAHRLMARQVAQLINAADRSGN